MIIKDPKKLSQRMAVLCIVIGLVALTVSVMAIAMKQYVIAAAMGIVAVGQAWNYKKWKKTAK